MDEQDRGDAGSGRRHGVVVGPEAMILGVRHIGNLTEQSHQKHFDESRRRSAEASTGDARKSQSGH
jgi:hypothetical protein